MLSFSNVTASSPELDSLLSIWQDQSRTDSIRIKAYDDYIRTGFLYSQPDSAIILSLKLETFAREQNYPKAHALSDYIKAAALYLQGYYSAALNLSMQSLKLSESLDFKDMTAINLNMFGLIYEKQGYYSRALDYHQRSLKLSEELGDKRGIAFSLNNIGEILNEQDNSSRALDYFERSYALMEELGNKRSMANAMMNIGLCHAYQGDFTRALDYYQRSLDYCEEAADKMGIIQCLHVIGKAHYAQNDISQALAYYQQSLDMSEDIDYKRGAVLSLTDIGNTYYYQGYNSSSLDYCKRSFELSEGMGALELQRSACECIYRNYKDIDNKVQALYYLEKLNDLDDSLNLRETTMALQKMEVNFQALKDSVSRAEEQRMVKEAYEEEARRNKRARNLSVAAGLFFLLLSGGYYSRWIYVRKSKAIIEKEKDRADQLLLNILPEEIAEELKEKGKADAHEFEEVSVLFTDFVDFTTISERLSAVELVQEVNICFEAFDNIIEKYSIEKIKTIGDSYMAAGGIPVPTADSVMNTVLAALEMQEFICSRMATKNARGEIGFKMRAGIHSGPVVAGIVGVKKFQYDLWGDTVNTASRIENNSEAGQVNISQNIFDVIKHDPQFALVSRGKIATKGKGEVEMYYVEKKLK